MSPPRRNNHTVAQAAALLDVPERLVRRWLAPRPPLFFAGAWQDDDGTWWIPDRDLRRVLGRRVEPQLSIQTVAVLMDVSDWTVRRWIRDGRLGTTSVCGRPRVPESELRKLIRPATA